MRINSKDCYRYAKGGYCCITPTCKVGRNRCNEISFCGHNFGRTKCHVTSCSNNLCISYKPVKIFQLEEAYTRYLISFPIYKEILKDMGYNVIKSERGFLYKKIIGSRKKDLFVDLSSKRLKRKNVVVGR